jgi:hypothetical protein
MATTIFTQALNADDSGDATDSFRQLVSPLTGASQGQVRVTFLSSTSAVYDTNNCSIGIATVSPPNTVAIPVELLFSGAHGFTLPANSSITSDWANFNCLSTDKLIIVMDIGSNGNPRFNSVLTAAVNSYFVTGASSYNLATVSGFNSQASFLTSVTLIETQPAVSSFVTTYRYHKTIR